MALLEQAIFFGSMIAWGLVAFLVYHVYQLARDPLRGVPGSPNTKLSAHYNTMQWLINLLKSLYSLETLDTRFARSTTASQNFASDPFSTSAPRLDKHSPLPGTKTSKWWTIERCVYYLVFVIVVPTMVKQVYDISKPGSPDWDSFSKRLSRGWIPGRQVDNSDAQYANFRDNIPYLIIILILHPLFRKLYGAFWRIDNYKFLDGSNTGLSHDPSPLTVADARLQHRTLFDFAFGVIFLIALHGVSAAKVLLIFYTNFNIATRLPRSYVPGGSKICHLLPALS